MKRSSAKLLQLLNICALALMLSACDRCGDWIKAEGGEKLFACKNDGPKTQ